MPSLRFWEGAHFTLWELRDEAAGGAGITGPLSFAHNCLRSPFSQEPVFQFSACLEPQSFLGVSQGSTVDLDL